MSVVVIGVGEGAICEAAFLHAVRTFPRGSTTFHLVYVRPDETEYLLEVLATKSVHTHRKEQRRHANHRAMLDKFRAMAYEAGVAHTAVILQGDTRWELCRYCAAVGADSLVVGSHGSSRIKRFLLGSVSKYCSKHAGCDVVVYRPSSHHSEVCVEG